MDIREEYNRHTKDVHISRSTNHPGLSVLKYKNSVFFNNSWDPFLEETRGLVIDDRFNIVSYPLTKMYNFRVEQNAPEWSDDLLVDGIRKVNGFMAACTWYEGKLLWSTTGSLDSPYVGLAEEMFAALSLKHQSVLKSVIALSEGKTFVFECVHPQDPHIIDEIPGLYLLASRKNELGSEVNYKFEDDIFHDIWFMTLSVYRQTVGEWLDESKFYRKEGFVLHGPNNEYTKIKSPYYLNKKFLMRKMDPLKKKKEDFPEEFYGLYDKIQADPGFKLLQEQDRRKYIETYFETEYAK